VLAWYSLQPDDAPSATSHTTMTKLRLGATSDWVHFIIIPIESVQKHTTLNGSHKGAALCTITIPSLLCGSGDMLMLRLIPPTHFILISSLHHIYIYVFVPSIVGEGYKEQSQPDIAGSYSCHRLGSMDSHGFWFLTWIAFCYD
jgi:hypothetical protein